MEAIMNEKAAEEKKGFWSGFITFLSMGGFLVILILGVAIAVFVSYLSN
jgi:heme/copper-type cytochrome/quinol oxidase subunit 2